LEPGRFQIEGKIENGYLASEDGKPIGRLVGVCIVNNPAVVPNESWNNDSASITGRLTEQQKYGDFKPPQEIIRYAAEFVRRLVPIPGELALWSIDQVCQQRQRITQRISDESAIPWITSEADCCISAFMKHEAMQKVTDPRMIMTFPNHHNLRLAQAVYPFKDLLKKKKWYMPGKSPPEIARAVCEFVRSRIRVITTD
jgi:hypothetical protein